MPEQSATPDVVELARRSLEVANHRDFDAMLSFWGSNAVWDVSPMGLGVYEGPVAIRGFFEDWIGAYEEWEIEPEEILDLGNGVILAVLLQNARVAGTSGHVRLHYAAVSVWIDGLVERTTNYGDINEARAAAERLAEERGQGA